MFNCLMVIGGFGVGYIIGKMFNIVCDTWARMNGYDDLKNRGFILMKDDDGNEWWVGYED
jgi:hypothetical protein